MLASLMRKRLALFRRPGWPGVAGFLGGECRTNRPPRASARDVSAQTFHGFCRSEVRVSASRSTAGSVNSGYRGRNTVSVVMRAALGVDCNEPSAVGTARNWLPADASKPAARTAVKIGAESRTQTGKTQNECSVAATPGHSTTDANPLA